MFQKIEIEVFVSAKIEKAWDCYTKPEHITQWNFASPDWCCPSAENDLVVGGRYKARMEARDGSFGFDFEGIYKEVELYKKLVFILADSRETNITFEENEKNSVRVSIVFDAENQNPLDLQKAGWQSILNNYKKYTESL